MIKVSEKDIQDFVAYGEERGKEKTVQTVFKILSPLLTKEQVNDLAQFMVNAFCCKHLDKALYGDTTVEMANFIANAGNDYTSKACLLTELLKLNESYGNRINFQVRKISGTPASVAKFLKRNEIKSKIQELQQKLKEL